MKTKIYLIVFLFMFCLGAMASPVDKERARQIATTFLNNNGARSSELSEVSAEAGFDNVYVFTTESSFVLVAADDRVQPILGYSLDGKFDTENIPDNMRAWVENYSDAIRYAINHQTRASDEVTRQWTNLEMGVDIHRAEVVVEPLIQTQWDQRSPYNMLCPSGTVTGCVATAMAQVMKYWNYPEHGMGSHSYIPKNHPEYGEQYANFNTTYYDWDNMVNTYYGNASPEQMQAVATLMYHCGVSIDMNYGPASTGGSGAATSSVATVLKTYFDYSSETQYISRLGFNDTIWISMLKAELNLNHPIQYNGKDSNNGGHSFVCDGYNNDDFFHFNWGWSGANDGYYSINSLNPGTGGAGSGEGVFNFNQGAIFGVCPPEECAANEPSNLVYVQDGRNITLTWTVASSATSYNIYRNNGLIGNTSENTYFDIALFGSSTYYVRSVDSNGRLSLSSNMVTVNVIYQTPIVDDLEATITDNTVNLTWTAPEWCYPESPTDSLTYGNTNNSTTSLGYNNGTTKLYWGHRYPASSLSSHNNMVVYKVSFLARETGAYQLLVFKGTDPSSGLPLTEIHHQSFSAGSIGWVDIELSETILVDDSQDLWVFLYDPEARSYPAAYCDYTGDEGNYYSTNISSWINTWPNSAFFIRTYLTDGAYTYNLYRNDESIANAIPDPHYTDSGLADGTYTYHLTTNYYGGETSPSNSVTVTVPGLVTQTVELGDTWTWWTPTAATTLAELETALGGNGILINSQDGGFVRYENGRWNGTLLDFEPGQMYRIKTQEASTITLTGAPVNQVSITIQAGINWIGYIGVAGATVSSVFGGDFTPAEGDKIISQDEGFAIYTITEGVGSWSGPLTLTTLKPGRGYVYISNASVNKTLTIE
jgi:hypothetical protein